MRYNREAWSAAMDLDAMVEKCRRGQWSVGDLDWSVPPRPMSREDEIAIVQYFTDMSGIERLAAALFAEQRRKVRDPRLREIFHWFVVDELRHAHVARLLAAHYDVHHYREYRLSPSLERFFPHFVDAIRFLSPEIANGYITGGELILDVALLRSLNDHVDDPTSQAAMDRVNRDESRHIAVDFHMVETYASDAFLAEKASRPSAGLGHELRAAWAFANVLWRAGPFFQDVFFRPMQHVDPSGKRLREAFKRMQLVGQKPDVQRLPFARFMKALQDFYSDHRWARWLFGRVFSRLAGVPGELLDRLYTEAEARAAASRTFDELADEALSLKYAS